MRICTSLASLAMLCVACTPPAEPTTSPDAASVAQADAAPAAATHALHPKIAEAAATPEVEKVKLRVDAQGNLVKQSVYHLQAAAIPEAVRKLAESKFPKGKPTRYETEVYADKGLVYEVEVKTADGKQCEVAASDDGTELYTECRVDPKDAPKPVLAKVAELFPKAKLLEVETKTGPGIDVVTVEVEADGKEYYLLFDKTGALQEKLRRVPAILEVPAP